MNEREALQQVVLAYRTTITASNASEVGAAAVKLRWAINDADKVLDRNPGVADPELEELRRLRAYCLRAHMLIFPREGMGGR